REAAPAGRGLGVGGRAHAGGQLLAPPDGEGRRGAGPAAPARRPVHLADDRSHHRRRGGLARPPGRREPGRAGRAHRLRRAARHRADHPPEAAARLPARRVPARARHGRRDRAARRAAHHARAAARPARGPRRRAQAAARAPVVSLVAELRADLEAAGIALTHFEFATLIAFEWFARLGIDVGVIEVGLGGRLDATNLVGPAVTAITSIALDHEAWLGHDLA